MVSAGDGLPGRFEFKTGFRSELMGGLDEFAPATLVVGPRGQGIEIEVAAWLQSQPSDSLRSVWLHAPDPREASHPGFDEELRAALRHGGLVPVGDARGAGALDLLEAVLEELHDEPVVLVVTAFEHLTDPELLKRLLGLVKRHRNFHLCACSETSHPIESQARGVVHLRVLYVTPGPEALQRAAWAVGCLLDRSWSQRIGAELELWSATLAHDLHGSRHGAAPPRAEPAEVADRLEEVEDDGLLRHLMWLAVAGPSTWRQFRELCGDPEPRQLLAAMESTGLVERIDGADELTFRVLPAVSDRLRDRYLRSEPEAVRELHRLLAGWMSGHGEDGRLARGFHHAAAGGDLALMDHFWSHGLGEMLREDCRLVSETLEALPATVLADRPLMTVFRDVLRVAAADSDNDSRRATVRAFTEACACLIRHDFESLPLNELLLVATGFLMHLRTLGRFQDSAAFADKMSARLSTLAGSETVSRGRLALFHLQRGINYTLLLDHPSAERSYRQAWEHATGTNLDFVQAETAGNLALCYAVEGEGARARQWLRRQQSFDTSGWPLNKIARAGGHVAAAMLAVDALEVAEARSELDELGEDLALLELWPYAAFVTAQLALVSGRADEAIVWLDHVQAACDAQLTNKGAAAALLARARADLFIAAGQGERAKQLLASQVAARSLYRLPTARLRLLSHCDDPAPAIDPLTWDPATPIRDRLEMLLIGAVTASRLDDSRNASRLINQALELREETGILRPFATVPNEDLRALLALADRRLEDDELNRIARLAPLYPERLDVIELSERELAILKSLARTGSRQEIADEHFVSLNTVKTHLVSIYHKLGTSSREETLAAAARHGLLA